MSYEVEVWEAAKADLAALEDREVQLAAVRIALRSATSRSSSRRFAIA